MVCDDVTTLLDAYVDRELDVVQDLAMAGHLQRARLVPSSTQPSSRCRILYALEGPTLRLHQPCVNAYGTPSEMQRRPLS